jgi:flagellar basal-body rod modification protein FlgD
MTAVNSATATTTAQQSGSTSASNPNATLDKDGFLKMFVAQMQNQDPSNSQDPNESTQQMATFSMVEQITNLVSQEQKVVSALNTSSAVGLIGRNVTYTDSTGVSKTGLVEKVATNASGASTLTVAGQAGIAPTSITEVA